MSKSDPIREKHYRAVERADTASDWLFYVTAGLSIASLFVDKAPHPVVYEPVQTCFALCVIALFGIGLANRLYWTPRAEDRRRQDFFAYAYGVNLSHQKTDGYYNNDLTSPIKRMAAQVLENSHFSKTIVLRMAGTERAKGIVYFIVWAVCVLNRQADLGFVVAASQAVFSEQILSKCVRLEFLRIRFEKTYDTVYQLFLAKPATGAFDAKALEALGMYETAKATGAITLSSKIFHEMNDALSKEWEQIKAGLGI